ncbi:MAG: NAD(P)H-hydrate dehydratase [Rhodoferax sp.]
MLRITPDRPHPLFDIAATRRLEQTAAAALPPHTLMQRAGLATARLALALAPHARTVWVACGPGNNGGDGLEAAAHLQRWGKQAVVTWLGDEASVPPDSLAALARARQADVRFAPEPPAGLTPQDLCIDALLGIGASRAPQGRMAQWIDALQCNAATMLAVDVPSGLNADTGTIATVSVADRRDPIMVKGLFHAQHTLSLLTLKPGLFTAEGRDAAGQVWFDDLGVASTGEIPAAMLSAPPATRARRHATHKGSYGDVAVIGGASGMTGAALLAASSALHGGAGRVFVALLDSAAPAVDTQQPELMLRPAAALDLKSMVVVCGCGGGDAVRRELPKLISTAAHAVLDADALNAIAIDTQLQTLLRARARRDGGRATTVLTPHPLEAARLLDTTAAQVQADRLGAARQLVERFDCVIVLKGSGTVIAAPGHFSAINPTGNARLATAGTGDVLAGMIGARIAAGRPAFAAACEAVYQHGLAADDWPGDRALTAAELAQTAGR